MATTGTYYYSSASFATATALYLDAALSTFAPDGWYSDQSIVRQQAAGVLFAEDDCPNCATPTPTPTPVVYDYRVYTACDGIASDEVFRIVQGGTFPATVSYNSICYHNPQATGSTSTINVSGLVSYTDCNACGTSPAPGPSPSPTPSPIPTPVPTITYDYREYSVCGTSVTKVFRKVSGNSFPAVLKDSGLCYENPSTTSLTSTNDITSIDYGDCATCEATTPTPTPTAAPTPAPTPTPTVSGTQIFSTYTVGNGVGNSTTACAAQATISMYTSRANVASIQVNDIMYTNSGLTNVWNGGLNFYGVTNVNGHYPDLDSGFALLIDSLGVVQQIVTCVAPTPAPVPAPSAATFQDVEIRKCFTTSPTYYVRVTGLTAPTLITGNTIKITGGASSPNPAFTNTDCWEIIDDAATQHDSSASINSVFSSCTACGATPTYDYATYTECQTSSTIVLRKLTTTTSFPSFVEYNNICYSNPVSTTATSVIDVESLTSFNNCYDCENPSFFINALPQQGYIEADACNHRTNNFVFSNRATVGQIIVGDTLYANSSKTTVFNGGLEWFSISNTLGYLPQSTDNKYLITSGGVVQAITSCTPPTPAPVPAPTPAPTTNIEVRDCANPSSQSAYITVLGTFGSNAVGTAIKISGGGGGSCGSGFNGTKCWEIINVNTVSDCSVTTLSVDNSCGACTPATPAPSPAPTPAPTPTTIYGRYLDCDDPSNVLDVSAPYGTTFPNVLKSGGICFSFDSNAGTGLNGSYTLYAAFNLCFDCQNPPTPSPTPSPAPTPSPSTACNPIALAPVSSATQPVDCVTEIGYFINTFDWCTATLLYNVPECNRGASAGYYTNGNFTRYWNGSAFTTLCTSTQCL